MRRLRSQSSECGNLFPPHGDVSRSQLLPGHADRVGPREGRPVVAPAHEALELLDLPLARHLDRVRVEGRRVGLGVRVRAAVAVGITKGLGVGVGVGVRVGARTRGKDIESMSSEPTSGATARYLPSPKYEGGSTCHTRHSE